MAERAVNATTCNDIERTTTKQKTWAEREKVRKRKETRVETKTKKYQGYTWYVRMQNDAHRNKNKKRRRSAVVLLVPLLPQLPPIPPHLLLRSFFLSWSCPPLLSLSLPLSLPLSLCESRPPLPSDPPLDLSARGRQNKQGARGQKGKARGVK